LSSRIFSGSVAVYTFLSEKTTANAIAFSNVGHPCGTRMTFCAITFCCQYFSKKVWLRRKIDNSVKSNFWQMCSFQTSTGTLLMFLVDEKMGAAAVDDEEAPLLVFWRLVGGAVAALLVPVVVSVSVEVDIF
jgi:hypothetical protein